MGKAGNAWLCACPACRPATHSQRDTAHHEQDPRRTILTNALSSPLRREEDNEAKLAEAMSEAAALQKKLAAADAQRKQAQEEAKAARRRVEGLEKAIEEERARKESAERAVEAARGRLEAAEEARKMAQTALKQAEAELQSESTRRRALEESLRESQQRGGLQGARLSPSDGAAGQGGVGDLSQGVEARLEAALQMCDVLRAEKEAATRAAVALRKDIESMRAVGRGKAGRRDDASASGSVARLADGASEGAGAAQQHAGPRMPTSQSVPASPQKIGAPWGGPTNRHATPSRTLYGVAPGTRGANAAPHNHSAAAAGASGGASGRELGAGAPDAVVGDRPSRASPSLSRGEGWEAPPATPAVAVGVYDEHPPGLPGQDAATAAPRVIPPLFATDRGDADGGVSGASARGGDGVEGAGGERDFVEWGRGMLGRAKGDLANGTSAGVDGEDEGLASAVAALDALFYPVGGVGSGGEAVGDSGLCLPGELREGKGETVAAAVRLDDCFCVFQAADRLRCL